jgi:gliding motility-associated-like protein
VQQQGKWYVMMVGGGAAVNNASRILKLDFGASITNPSPVATNWGNIGNMERPVDLHIFQEGNDWYGFTVNAGTNTITRFNFGADFNNTPTAVNLGNIGGLNFPTGIYAIKDNTNWRIFVVNGATATGTSLTRLDFGASLLNVPTGVNLGNPGNALHQPRDFTIMKSCGQVVGFAVNGQAGFYDLVKLDFNNDLSSVPTATSLGSTGSLNFPHSISKLFRVNENLYSFITNVANNTITRLEFQGCTNASIPNSALKDPPAVIYKVPGTYSINLTVDDGLATQTAFCRQVVVKPIPTPDFSFEQDVCNPLSVQFKNETTGNFTSKWNFGNGTGSLLPAPVVVYNAYQSYVVKLVAGGGMCADSIEKIILVNLERDSLVTRHDTTSCDGKGVELQALPGLVYCWSPAATLSDAAAPNPIATPVVKTTYYVRSQVTGKNLITNGDFSQGNMAFSSDYSYLPSNGFPSGVYTVYSDPRVWHAGFSACSDHTGAGGNMMLVNGSSDPGKKVWSQTVTVAPNSNYAFSTWIQTLTSSNPGSLQFSINGIQLGNVFTASAQTCKWNQFYTAWNSGNNTSVTISIVNVNLALGGNDFALDDIFFGTIGMKYDSVTVGLIRSPVLTTTPDTLLCLGDTIRLVAAGALHYNWSPAQAISNTAVPGPFVYPVATTAYTVKAYNTPGCEAAQAIAVRVSPAPAFAITPAVTSVCEGEAVRITASGADHYTWMADSQLMNNQPGNQIGISPAKTMTYSVKVTDDLCNRTDTLYSLVKVIAKPVTHVSKTSDIDCMTGGARLNAIGGTTYHWSPATGLSDTEIASPVVLAMQTTKYYVTVSKEGCSAVDSVTVVVNLNTPGNLYLVPTAFTPNGDGKNDCFGLKHWGQLKDLNFAIYNRWGQQIFLTRDVSNCWDGTFKGERQPPGAFIYVISGVTLCGPVLRRGTVLLIR